MTATRQYKRTAKRNATGLILWEGISLIDRKTPIVVIATGVYGSRSTNRKTGGMIQTYILRSDMPPLQAIATGADSAICGGCMHRKQPDYVDSKNRIRKGKRTCYVNVGQGATSVYKAFTRGRYNRTNMEHVREIARDRFIRFGTYGDPAAAPVELWATLAGAAGGYTGYTHQWRSARFASLAPYVQASCDSEEDVALAHAKGFRGTFLVLPIGATRPAAAMPCPASEEEGKKVQCIDCRKCNGTRDVVIYAHGPSKNLYQLERRKMAA